MVLWMASDWLQSAKSGFRMASDWLQSGGHPKVASKWLQNTITTNPRGRARSARPPSFVAGSILKPLLDACHFEANLKPFWSQFWATFDKTSTKLDLKTRIKCTMRLPWLYTKRSSNDPATVGKPYCTISNPGWVPGQIRNKFGKSAQNGLRKWGKT